MALHTVFPRPVGVDRVGGPERVREGEDKECQCCQIFYRHTLLTLSHELGKYGLFFSAVITVKVEKLKKAFFTMTGSAYELMGIITEELFLSFFLFRCIGQPWVRNVYIVTGAAAYCTRGVPFPHRAEKGK
jgi:hypothetical protein